MIASIIVFIVALIVRIIFGYVSTIYDYLVAWLPWFTALAAVTGGIAVVFIIIKIVKAIKSK